MSSGHDNAAGGDIDPGHGQAVRDAIRAARKEALKQGEPLPPVRVFSTGSGAHHFAQLGMTAGTVVYVPSEGKAFVHPGGPDAMTGSAGHSAAHRFAVALNALGRIEDREISGPGKAKAAARLASLVFPGTFGSRARTKYQARASRPPASQGRAAPGQAPGASRGWGTR